MEVMDAIKSRRSIRGYLSDPISQDILREILAAATSAPSAVNTQPWEFTVVQGEALDKIKRENVEKHLAGVAVSERGSNYSGVYRQRQVELAIDIYSLLGIQREDKEKRSWWYQRGFRFFDAPVAVIVSTDKSLDNSWALFDLGVVTQTLCLAAMNYGIATCIEEQGVKYHDVIYKNTGITADKEIVIGIALGYPDPAFPGNKIISRRETLDNITRWIGF